MIPKKILVMGLPGAGKTTLARALARNLAAVHFEADAVRLHINRDLGFSLDDRIEQARRMGWLCDRVVEAGHTAIADFVCPTDACRGAFGSAFVIFVDRIKQSRYADTDALFVPPKNFQIRIGGIGDTADLTWRFDARSWSETIKTALNGGAYPRHPLRSPAAPATDGHGSPDTSPSDRDVSQAPTSSVHK